MQGGGCLLAKIEKVYVMPRKKTPARVKYANGTTYKDSKGRTHKRTSAKGTKRGDAYCARSSGQKQTEKVKVRRKAWGCRGKKSVRSGGK